MKGIVILAISLYSFYTNAQKVLVFQIPFASISYAGLVKNGTETGFIHKDIRNLTICNAGLIHRGKYSITMQVDAFTGSFKQPEFASLVSDYPDLLPFENGDLKRVNLNDNQYFHPSFNQGYHHATFGIKALKLFSKGKLDWGFGAIVNICLPKSATDVSGFINDKQQLYIRSLITRYSTFSFQIPAEMGMYVGKHIKFNVFAVWYLSSMGGSSVAYQRYSSFNDYPVIGFSQPNSLQHLAGGGASVFYYLELDSPGGLKKLCKQVRKRMIGY